MDTAEIINFTLQTRVSSLLAPNTGVANNSPNTDVIIHYSNVGVVIHCPNTSVVVQMRASSLLSSNSRIEPLNSNASVVVQTQALSSKCEYVTPSSKRGRHQSLLLTRRLSFFIPNVRVTFYNRSY